ncbi:MAG: DUF3991 domain-containing protein [Candidatus Krumholzibacteria bacterium]|nr:DUF3991 domain-containing protein [Candidatus Krumholzibacteria bacterium]
MNFDDLRRRADVVRTLPLENVLLARGAVRDRRDRRKWHTEQGPLSVSGPKFINWRRGQGGGGAIDLVMHLAGVDFRTAVAWLQQHLTAGPPTTARAAGREAATPATCERSRTLRLPTPDDRMLDRVRQYLTGCRRLEPSLIETLIHSGKLYADSHGNAVFLLVAGKAQHPVGAELRGTGPRTWRGLAPGTRKDLGYFWIGVQGFREVVLCESAIDAISCFQLSPQRICISTAGVRSDPPWLPGLLARGFELYCGFDADDPGDAAAARMMALHPSIRRLRPPAHDWNDALAADR